MKAARAGGTKVSYDLNYRPSLWKSIGGKAKAQEVNRKLSQHVDVLIGNEEDFQVALGLEIAGVDANFKHLETEHYKAMIDEAVKQFPNLEVVAVTLRTVHSASNNDWTAIAWSKAEGFAIGRNYKNLEIFDRVGGGDSFASGLICGLLEGKSLQESVELGLAHGALAMTTPGDTSMATRTEVEKLARGGNARVDR
jgi:2-dehydro-3-deoxygluconokinase